MLRKGFTLIELLVVITIVAILAGAAIPYVQDYVEDGRYARAKQDLDEIRNALARFEIDRGVLYTTGNIGALIGPYLSKSIVDPWGGAYVVDSGVSKISSNGPNGIAGDGDDVSEEYRPPLALSKAFWEDTNQNGVVDTGDTLIMKFTRPTNGPVTLLADLAFSAGAPTAIAAPVWELDDRQAKIVMTNPTFVPGKDTLDIAVPANMTDGTNDCKNGFPVPIKAR